VHPVISRRTGRRSERLADRGGSVPGTVIVGGDYQGLGIARSLGRHGIPVCVVDDETCIARASRFVKHVIRVRDLGTDGSLVDALALARQRLGGSRCVLYATRDETVAAIAAIREKLTGDFRVPTPEMPAIRHARDKRQTYRLAAQLSIAIPRTWFPQSEEDLADMPVDGPLVIKPAIKELLYQARAKAWRADHNAVCDIRAGTQRLRDYLRSLRHVDTEAVYSLSDPLPGLYEIALLPYLAMKRGL
jgi:D-aspartate ligase